MAWNDNCYDKDGNRLLFSKDYQIVYDENGNKTGTCRNGVVFDLNNNQIYPKPAESMADILKNIF